MRDLHRQYMAMKAEMDDAVSAVVASSAFIMGEPVAELERQLADYLGVKHCVSCASGTDALRLALMAWGIGEGDAVFVPDFTFFATAEAVALQGATPVFVDVSSDTYNICSDSLLEKVEEVQKQGRLHPAVVIAVDLFGQPADYPAIREICRRYDMLLLEDGAQGFGGSMSGRKACSFGDISTTSFFPAKPLGCYGDGGALFTDNDEWAMMLRSLRVHGKGMDKYDNVRIGLNSRLDTIQAAILQVKLRHFEDELSAVNRIADRYGDLLKGKVTVPNVAEGVVSSWAQYTVQCDDRESIRTRLRVAGIPSAIYYPRPLSRQSAFVALEQRHCTNADLLCEKVLSLPMHPYLTDEEIEMIVAAI